ncbi:protein FAM177A1 [Amia ocellicauda]|uniref:protein FAM177A1 n=1 Tax=Amia ocellicauda TaxID=2972642 RepID=UPI003464670D
MNKDLKHDTDVQHTDFGRKGSLPGKGQKRLIHFASGETLEEDSTDEDEIVAQDELFKAPVDTAQMSWGSKAWFLWMQVAKRSILTCDYLGGKLANVLGLNAAKYQYAIDEYLRDTNEPSQDEDGNEIPQKQAAETQHFPLQNTEYGTMNSLASTRPEPPHYSTTHITEQPGAGTRNPGYVDDEQ